MLGDYNRNLFNFDLLNGFGFFRTKFQFAITFRTSVKSVQIPIVYLLRFEQFPLMSLMAFLGTLFILFPILFLFRFLTISLEGDLLEVEEFFERDATFFLKFQPRFSNRRFPRLSVFLSFDRNLFH
jgi:hypothetical protein